MEMRCESCPAYWKRSHLGSPHMDVDNAEEGTYREFALVFSVHSSVYLGATRLLQDALQIRFIANQQKLITSLS